MSITIKMADGDIYLDSAGRAEEISGPNKASQDTAEVLLTPLDRVRDYGSELADLDVPPLISAFAGKALISKKVDEAIQRLRRYQQTDGEVTDDERIEKINRLIVNNLNATDFVFWVDLLLRDQTFTSAQIFAVSLRHQESARFNETIEELVRRGLGKASV